MKTENQPIDTSQAERKTLGDLALSLAKSWPREPKLPSLHLFFEKLLKSDGRICDFKCNGEWHRGKIRTDRDWIFFNSPSANWCVNKNTTDISILVKNDWEEVKIDDCSFVFKASASNPKPNLKPTPPSDQWKVGDVITKGSNQCVIESILGQRIQCVYFDANMDLFATINYTLDELKETGWRLKAKKTKPAPTKIEMLESELEKAKKDLEDISEDCRWAAFSDRLKIMEYIFELETKIKEEKSKPTKERLRIGIGLKYSEREQRYNPCRIEENSDWLRKSILKRIAEDIESLCEITDNPENNTITGEIEILVSKEKYDLMMGKR